MHRYGHRPINRRHDDNELGAVLRVPLPRYVYLSMKEYSQLSAYLRKKQLLSKSRSTCSETLIARLINRNSQDPPKNSNTDTCSALCLPLSYELC